MIYIISFQKGYGKDLDIGRLGIEEAAFYGPDKYWSLKVLKEKFDINFKKEDELSELSLSREEKGKTPLLDFSLYEPKNRKEEFRLKNIFRNVTKKVIQKLNNFVSVYECKECGHPSELIVTNTEEHGNGTTYHFDQTDYYCDGCTGEKFLKRRTPNIHIAEIAFDSTFAFPEDVQYTAYRILRGATGFDSEKMGNTKEERRKYCQDIVNNLTVRTGPQKFLISPYELGPGKVPPIRSHRRKRKIQEAPKEQASLFN